MRQLIVTGGYPCSTHTFVIRDVAASLAAGHEVYVLAPNDGDAAGGTTAKALGMPDQKHLIYGNYHNSSIFSPGFCRFGARVRSVADAARYGRVLAERRKTFFCEVLSCLPRLDLVHAHFSGWAFEVALPLSQILGVPLTVTVHDSHEQLRQRELGMLQRLQASAAGLALVSESSKAIGVKRTGSDERLRVIYNGIDLSEFPENAEVSPGMGINILSVGRLANGKRIDEGIRIFGQLKSRSHGCHYRIIGEGPERARLQALANQLGLDTSITFHGNLEHAQVRRRLVESDILLHPGVDESFGLVVAEAMAAGKPVVAARSGAIPELLADQESGYLYPSGDESLAVKYLAGLVDNNKRRLAMGRYARKVVEDKFSWTLHRHLMHRLWADAIAHHTRKYT